MPAIQGKPVAGNAYQEPPAFVRTGNLDSTTRGTWALCIGEALAGSGTLIQTLAWAAVTETGTRLTLWGPAPTCFDLSILLGQHAAPEGTGWVIMDPFVFKTTEPVDTFRPFSVYPEPPHFARSCNLDAHAAARYPTMGFDTGNVMAGIRWVHPVSVVHSLGAIQPCEIAPMRPGQCSITLDTHVGVYPLGVVDTGAVPPRAPWRDPYRARFIYQEPPSFARASSLGAGQPPWQPFTSGFESGPVLAGPATARLPAAAYKDGAILRGEAATDLPGFARSANLDAHVAALDIVVLDALVAPPDPIPYGVYLPLGGYPEPPVFVRATGMDRAVAGWSRDGIDAILPFVGTRSVPVLALPTTLDWVAPPYLQTRDLGEQRQAHIPPFSIVDLRGPIMATGIDPLPGIEVVHHTVSGARVHCFGNDWYGHRHLLPKRLSLGNIINHATRNIEVWNSSDRAATLTAMTFTGTGGGGLALTGQAEPPLDFGPLQSRRFTLSVATAGDPVIDILYHFDFGGSLLSLAVSGQRIVTWVFAPDWTYGVTERHEWLTDILPAYDGSEQRVRLRDHARRKIEYAFLATGHELRWLASITLGWSGRRYALPIWWEADGLSDTSPMGAMSVRVTDAALKGYREGGLLMFWQSSGWSETLEVQAVAGDRIDLKVALSQAFPAGSRVMPAVLARIEGETTYTQITDQIVSGRIRFGVDDSLDRDPAEIGSLWEGHAVLDVRPDRSTPVETTWERELAILDSLAGSVTVDDPGDSQILHQTAAWLIAGRREIDRWLRWAAARAGRCQALWLPTFTDDLVLMQSVGAFATTLPIRNTWMARYVGVHPLQNAVRIEGVDGQVWHRRVLALSEIDATTEYLMVDTALGVPLAVDAVLRISWMGLARLESDAVEIHYVTDGLARLQTTFRRVTA